MVWCKQDLKLRLSVLIRGIDAVDLYAYLSLTDVREFTEKDSLPGDDILPGLDLAVTLLFEE
jgi:hypothetical protein